MVDVLARLPGPLAIGSDTPAPIALLGGGSAANTAAWLAAAGARVTLIARVGDDALGRSAVAELAAAGVDLAVTVDPDRPTGTCIVLVDPAGERTMVPAAGANESVGDILPAVSVGEQLHVSGYPLLRATSSAAVAAALTRARTAGASVSVDAASAAPLRDFGARRFLDLIGAALLFANADEATVLTGADDPGEAARRLGARCGQAIVKCGADGAMWSDAPGPAMRSQRASSPPSPGPPMHPPRCTPATSSRAGRSPARVHGRRQGRAVLPGRRRTVRQVRRGMAAGQVVLEVVPQLAELEHDLVQLARVETAHCIRNVAEQGIRALRVAHRTQAARIQRDVSATA
jgi:sugar/nucleoside kinase (ribokinase family)